MYLAVIRKIFIFAPLRLVFKGRQMLDSRPAGLCA